MKDRELCIRRSTRRTALRDIMTSLGRAGEAAEEMRRAAGAGWLYLLLEANECRGYCCLQPGQVVQSLYLSQFFVAEEARFRGLDAGFLRVIGLWAGRIPLWSAVGLSDLPMLALLLRFGFEPMGRDIGADPDDPLIRLLCDIPGARAMEGQEGVQARRAALR